MASRRALQSRLKKISETSVKIIKNEVGWGLRKIVACSHSSSQCLLVSTVFGMVSSLHPTLFLMIFTLVLISLLMRIKIVLCGACILFCLVPMPLCLRSSPYSTAMNWTALHRKAKFCVIVLSSLPVNSRRRPTIKSTTLVMRVN